MNIENKDQSLVINQDIERLASDNNIEIGSWYILDTTDNSLFHRTSDTHDDTEITPSETSALVCANRFESNLVVLHSNNQEYRVLSRNMDKVLSSVSESEAFKMVNAELASRRQTINLLQQQMQLVIQNINPPKMPGSTGTDIIIATKDALIEKSNELKNVHGNEIERIGKDIEHNVAAITQIAGYITLPAQINMHQIGEGKAIIDEKVHDLSIYGGLHEQEFIVSEGYCARDDEPVYIYQNLKYMDVECIDAYVDGGIDSYSITRFDKWLSEPKNRDRVMPHSKCIVAIKNRLTPKRGGGWSSLPNETYLYLRNGDNIKRLKSLIAIGKTLLATDNTMGAETFVKAYASKRRPSFDFMTANQYEFEINTARKLKSAYIQSILDQCRLDIKFLTGLTKYLKGRKNAVKIIDSRNADPIDIKVPSSDKQEITLSQIDKDIQELRSYADKLKVTLDLLLQDPEKLVGINISYTRRDTYNAVCKLSSITKQGSSLSERHSVWLTTETSYIDTNGQRHDLEITTSDYENLDEQIKKKYKELINSAGKKTRDGEYNPFDAQYEAEQFNPVNDDHYFFDDIKKAMWSDYKRQNELAVLIQGIIDRTAFFGYVEASLFKSGYEEKIKLVYDKQGGLYDGDEPDFKAFINGLNEASEAGDVFYGQASVWAELERERSSAFKERHGYYGVDTISMPTYLKAEKIINKRDGRRVALFRWQTEREFWSTAKSEFRNHKFECDINSLINVSKYNQGDHLQFINDPRCREKYSEWGRKIMRAEEFYALSQHTSL